MSGTRRAGARGEFDEEREELSCTNPMFKETEPPGSAEPEQRPAEAKRSSSRRSSSHSFVRRLSQLARVGAPSRASAPRAAPPPPPALSESTQTSSSIEEAADALKKRKSQRQSNRRSMASLADIEKAVLHETVLPSERIAEEDAESEVDGVDGDRDAAAKAALLEVEEAIELDSGGGNTGSASSAESEAATEREKEACRRASVARSRRRSERHSARLSQRPSRRASERARNSRAGRASVRRSEKRPASARSTPEAVLEAETIDAACAAVDDGACRILPEIFALEGRSIVLHVAEFLSVRQMVELAFVSPAFMRKLRGAPVRLEYYKRTFDFHVLDRTFNDFYQSQRLTPWTVAGLYTSINDLSTLFQSVDPTKIEFLGIVNPHLSSIKHIRACTNLRRFELHACDKPVSLEPLLELSATLEGVSVLACKEIRDITLLERLPKLRVLSAFKSSNVTALPDLSRCKDLQMLSIGTCVNIRDVRSILSLRHLRVLDLSFVRCVTSLSFLRNVAALRVLILDSCKNLEDISALAVFGSTLRVLRLNGVMNLNDISGVRHCPKLISLELGDLVHLRDLSALEACTKLQDLVLLNCVSIKSLRPLAGAAKSLKRLMLTGCRNIQEPEDAAFVESCSDLIIFDCERCNPAFLVELMLSERQSILAAAESRLALVTAQDFNLKAYPAILRNLAAEDDEVRRRAALRVIQVVSQNISALTHMVKEGNMSNRLVRILLEDEFDDDCYDSPLSDDEDDAAAGRPQHLSFATKLEVIRTIATFARNSEAASSILQITGSVEYLASTLAAAAKPCEGCGKIWAHRADFDEEHIVCEAAKALALLVEHTTSQHLKKLLVRRMDAAGVPASATALLSAELTLNQTRRPLLLAVRFMIETESSIAKRVLPLGIVGGVVRGMLRGSTDTRVVGCALLATVTSATGPSSVAEIIEIDGAKQMLVGFLRSQHHELVKHATMILSQLPEYRVMDLVRTPGLVAATLHNLQREISRKLHVGILHSQGDPLLVRRCAELIAKISSNPFCVKEMIAEEDHPAIESSGTPSADPASASQRGQRASAESDASLPRGGRAGARGESDSDASASFFETASQASALTNFEEDAPLARGTRPEPVSQADTHRVSCELVVEVLSAATMTGPREACVLAARALINLCKASEAVWSTTVDTYSQPGALTGIASFVIKHREVKSDPSVGPELLLLFVREPGLAEGFGKLPPGTVPELCQALVHLVDKSSADVQVVSRVVAALARTPIKQAMLDSVVVPVVSSIDKRKSHLQMLVARLFDRNSLHKRGQKPPSGEELVEDAHARKRRALGFLSSLLIDTGTSSAARVLLDKNRLEVLFVSMNEPDFAVQEFSLLIISHIVERVDRDGEERLVYAQLGADLYSLFEKNSEYGVFCLNLILAAGSRRSRYCAVKLLATLCAKESMARMVLDTVPDFVLTADSTASGGNGRVSEASTAALAAMAFATGAAEAEAEAEAEFEEDEALERALREAGEAQASVNADDEVGLRGGLAIRFAQVEAGVSSADAEAEEKTRATEAQKGKRSSWRSFSSRSSGHASARSSAASARPESASRGSVSRGSIRRGSARRNVSLPPGVAPPPPLLEALLEFVLDAGQPVKKAPPPPPPTARSSTSAAAAAAAATASALAEQENRLQGDREAERACELIATLARADSAQVEERVLRPLIQALKSKVATPAERRSQERVAAVMYFLSQRGEEHTMDLLMRTDAFVALALYFCSAQSTELGKQRSVTAIGNYVGGDPSKMLGLDGLDVDSGDGKTSFLRELVAEMQHGSGLTRSILQVISPMFVGPSKSLLGQGPDSVGSGRPAPRLEAGAEAGRRFAREVQQAPAQVEALSSCLVHYGLMDLLEDWQHNMVADATSLKSAGDVELGRVLLKPALRVSKSDSVVAGKLRDFNLVDLFVHLYVSDSRPSMREMYSRTLADLDPGFLDDHSDVFLSTLGADPTFASRLQAESEFEVEQLEWFPAAFQRVRGFPSPYRYDDINVVSILEWTTMALKLDCAGRQARVVHQKMYYEVEVLEVAGVAVVGWVSSAFRHGVLYGHSSVGVAEDAAGFGMRIDHLAANDVIGMACDIEERRLTCTVNGKVVELRAIGEGATQLVPAITASKLECALNFGSQPFKFAPPSGRFRPVYRCLTNL